MLLFSPLLLKESKYLKGKVDHIIIYFKFRDFFEQRFNLPGQEANTVNSMIYIVSAIASPFFGILIDKVGKNLMWVVYSIILTAVAHSILIFTYLNPYVGTVIVIYSYCYIYLIYLQFLDYHGIGIFLIS